MIHRLLRSDLMAATPLIVASLFSFTAYCISGGAWNLGMAYLDLAMCGALSVFFGRFTKAHEARMYEIESRIYDLRLEFYTIDAIDPESQ